VKTKDLKNIERKFPKEIAILTEELYLKLERIENKEKMMENEEMEEELYQKWREMLQKLIETQKRKETKNNIEKIFLRYPKILFLTN